MPLIVRFNLKDLNRHQWRMTFIIAPAPGLHFCVFTIGTGGAGRSIRTFPDQPGERNLLLFFCDLRGGAEAIGLLRTVTRRQPMTRARFDRAVGMRGRSARAFSRTRVSGESKFQFMGVRVGLYAVFRICHALCRQCRLISLETEIGHATIEDALTAPRQTSLHQKSQKIA